MKIVLLGDTHLGARGGDEDFANLFNTFFTDTLYPYMKENDIDTIIQLGDLFDNRTNLMYKSYYINKDVWFNPLRENGWTMYTLLGNHDIHYRNTLEINSPELLLGEYSDCLTVINRPTQLDFDGYKIDVVPWICKDNQDEVSKFIKRKDIGSVLVGHLEVVGFSMYKGGVPSKHGMSRTDLEEYPFVFSGHYHHKSNIGNIHYLGTPYEITWADFADPKGFHVFDTEKQTLEFVENPNTMFRRISYDRGSDVDPSTLSGKIVKLLVQDRGEQIKYDSFLSSLRESGLKDLDIIENKMFVREEVDVERVEVEDPLTFAKKYIDSIETNVEKDDLKSYFEILYSEAMRRC